MLWRVIRLYRDIPFHFPLHEPSQGDLRRGTRNSTWRLKSRHLLIARQLECVPVVSLYRWWVNRGEADYAYAQCRTLRR